MSESVFADICLDESPGAPQPSLDIPGKYWEYLREKALALSASREIDLREADARFSTALNLRRVRNVSVCVIGAGGLGNWQWRILASMGFTRIIVYDDDVVGLENVGPQAHSIFDIGLPKVEAVRRAALQYRGMGIAARNKKVFSLSDICEDLGFCPDVIIGCTDSADFRREFVESMGMRVTLGHHSTHFQEADFPELWLDFRMSLGDWACYALPLRRMHHIRRRWGSGVTRFVHSMWSRYQSEAIFSADAALQEPCTARAIAYTGASAASYSGAFLHWLYSDGLASLDNQEALEDFFALETKQNFSWRMLHSSRDWESISPTVSTTRLAKKLRKAEEATPVAGRCFMTHMQEYTGVELNMEDSHFASGKDVVGNFPWERRAGYLLYDCQSCIARLTARGRSFLDSVDWIYLRGASDAENSKGYVLRHNCRIGEPGNQEFCAVSVAGQDDNGLVALLRAGVCSEFPLLGGGRLRLREERDYCFVERTDQDGKWVRISLAEAQTLRTTTDAEAQTLRTTTDAEAQTLRTTTDAEAPEDGPNVGDRFMLGITPVTLLEKGARWRVRDEENGEIFLMRPLRTVEAVSA